LSNLPMTRDDDETDAENTHREHTEARNECMNPCMRA
jgi:hypothetical protein